MSNGGSTMVEHLTHISSVRIRLLAPGEKKMTKNGYEDGNDGSDTNDNDNKRGDKDNDTNDDSDNGDGNSNNSNVKVVCDNETHNSYKK
jgi:hypothetical protein